MILYKVEMPDGTIETISKKEKKGFCNKYKINTSHLSHTNPKHIGTPTYRKCGAHGLTGVYRILQEWDDAFAWEDQVDLPMDEEDLFVEGEIQEFVKDVNSDLFEEKETVESKKRKYIPRVYKNENSTRLAVLLGDLHFNYADKDAVDIMKQVCGDYSEFIDEYIDGGDGINNDALSKWTSTEEVQYTLYEEMKGFEGHMYDMKEILPKAKFIVVDDNHYTIRVKRFISENPAMKGLLKEIDFPFDVQMPHGHPYLPFGQDRIGVIHGLVTNDNFTKGHSALFNIDLVNFHTHSSQHYTCKNGSKILNKHPQKMWGMPSMCKQMEYMNGRPSRSNTGFGLLWYDLDTATYQLQYVFVEDGIAMVNGKVYRSRI